MTQPLPVEQQIKGFRDDFAAIGREVGRVVVGQSEAVEAALIGAVAGGHVLLEGPPGVGKTALVAALADALSLSFQRIQFTPDLMPADLLGTYVVMETPQGRRTFEFQKGPIFAHMILADHINRGLPKTQSALLEAMEGDEISVSNQAFQLPQPFFVLATQNPGEMGGVYPLPEPELDRFMLKVVCRRLSVEEIESVLERTTEGELPPVTRVCDGKRLLEMRAIARQVPLSAALRRHVATLVAASHPDGPRAPELVRRYVSYGPSPRAAQAIVLGAKIRAAAAGRGEVALDDIRALAPSALAHRVVLNFAGQAENITSVQIIEAVTQAAK